MESTQRLLRVRLVRIGTIVEATAAVLADPGLKPNTRKRYANVFEHFGGHFGKETKLQDIPREKFASYADAVSIRSTWSVKTKSIYISIAQRLFGFYEARNGAVGRITTKGLKPKRLQPASFDRMGHKLAEYRVIFANAAKYRTKEPHKWWVTVACAFLGCRIEELAHGTRTRHYNICDTAP